MSGERVVRTTIAFERLGSLRPEPVVVDRALDAWDVLDVVRTLVIRLGVWLDGVEIDVDLPAGAAEGRVWVYHRRAPVGEASVVVREVDLEPVVAPIVYPGTRSPVVPGDVVSLGRLGSALYQVVEVTEASAWLRNTGRRREQRVEPVGRLRLVERGAL